MTSSLAFVPEYPTAESAATTCEIVAPQCAHSPT